MFGASLGHDGIEEGSVESVFRFYFTTFIYMKQIDSYPIWTTVVYKVATGFELYVWQKDKTLRYRRKTERSITEED